MNVITAQAATAQPQTTTSSYEVQEQGDGQLLITTHPARVPTFTFDAAVIIGGFAFTVLALDYFLFGANLYLAALVLTLIGAGAAWLCLKILHRERRKGVRPCRFYVSGAAINIPPASDSNDKMTLLQASTLDRLVIRSTIVHEETTSSAFGKVGARGMEAKDRRTAWFADHSYSVEAESAGRTFQLANGLDETTANGLMKTISRKLGF